ncbi:MAG TPA: PH domain-containing protein [Thermoanaerobaculia bacterium]|nr:PH domain-containing protein [Thermoanaerobaculia bacterium]
MSDHAAAAEPSPALGERVTALERPHRSLLTYFALQSLVLGPLFPLALVPLYFKYHTLRYRFDEQGVSMRWGLLFRREISLNYARIQDIHLASNFVERWLGLARVQLQTASGSAGAEMTIEGLQEFEEVRDFLYTRMRGARRLGVARVAAPVARAVDESGAGGVAAALREVAAELREVRSLLESSRGPHDQPRREAIR